MKRALILKKTDKYIIHSQSQTVYGLWIASEPYIILPISTSQEELYKQVKNALLQSKQNVPHPTDWKSFHNNYLDYLNEKTLKKLNTNSKVCEIEQIENIITIFPTLNRGIKEGYEQIQGRDISISINDDFCENIFEAFNLFL